MLKNKVVVLNTHLRRHTISDRRLRVNLRGTQQLSGQAVIRLTGSGDDAFLFGELHGKIFVCGEADAREAHVHKLGNAVPLGRFSRAGERRGGFQTNVDKSFNGFGGDRCRCGWRCGGAAGEHEQAGQSQRAEQRIGHDAGMLPFEIRKYSRLAETAGPGGVHDK